MCSRKNRWNSFLSILSSLVCHQVSPHSPLSIFTLSFKNKKKTLFCGFPSSSHHLLGSSGLSLGLLSDASVLASLLGSSGLGAVVLGHGLENGLLLLGVNDGDGVGKSLLGAGLALGVRAAHNLDLDTEDTLAEQDVAGGGVDEVVLGLTRVDHEAVGELHGLGTGSTELAGDDNLAALGVRLHDEAEDTVAGAADGQAVEELVAERLALGDGGQTAVLDLGGVQRDRVLGELEALLDQRGELADAAALLAEDLLGLGGADDDVGDGRGDADLDAGVALLGQLALEELVELGVEDTVSDELSPLGAKKKRGLLVYAFPRYVCAVSWSLGFLSRKSRFTSGVNVSRCVVSVSPCLPL